MTDKTQPTQTEKQADKEQEPVQDRRKAMKKLWKYTAYTAPAVTALLIPTRTARASGPPSPSPPPPPPPPSPSPS